MTEGTFRAIYRHGDDGYVIASTPELPGAFGQGTTTDEAREDLKSAILLMLEDEALDGDRSEQPLLEEDLVVAIA